MVPRDMDIKEVTFKARQYLMIKKAIAASQIADKDMYDKAGKKLGEYLHAHNATPTGAWSVLYFLWDPAHDKAEIGIAMPVSGLHSVDDSSLELLYLPDSPAALGVMKGPYSGLQDAHAALAAYAQENKLPPPSFGVIAIEEYVADPMTTRDPKDYVTNIYYLHD